MPFATCRPRKPSVRSRSSCSRARATGRSAMADFLPIPSSSPTSHLQPPRSSPAIESPTRSAASRLTSNARSLAFAAYQLVLTPVYAVLVLLLFWLPARARYHFIIGWCWLTLFGARWICGIRQRTLRETDPPSGPHVVMCKPSSTWETLAINFLFPPLAFV